MCFESALAGNKHLLAPRELQTIITVRRDLGDAELKVTQPELFSSTPGTTPFTCERAVQRDKGHRGQDENYQQLFYHMSLASEVFTSQRANPDIP